MTPFEFLVLPLRVLEWAIDHSEDIFAVAFALFLWAAFVFGTFCLYNFFRGF